MSVIVKVGTVDTGERVYLPGELIVGLKEKDEQELVGLGVCDYAGPESSTKDKNDAGDPDVDEDGLVKLGGGYYQLPNGEKVRGRENALEALAELNKQQNPDGDKDDDGDGEEPDGPNTDLLGVDA